MVELYQKPTHLACWIDFNRIGTGDNRNNLASTILTSHDSHVPLFPAIGHQNVMAAVESVVVGWSIEGRNRIACDVTRRLGHSSTGRVEEFSVKASAGRYGEETPIFGTDAQKRKSSVSYVTSHQSLGGTNILPVDLSVFRVAHYLPREFIGAVRLSSVFNQVGIGFVVEPIPYLVKPAGHIFRDVLRLGFQVVDVVGLIQDLRFSASGAAIPSISNATFIHLLLGLH